MDWEESFEKILEEYPIFEEDWDELMDRAELEALRELVQKQRDVLWSISQHRKILGGPRAHRLSCDCGGTVSYGYSCRSLQEAFQEAHDLSTNYGPFRTYPFSPVDKSSSEENK